MRIATVKWIILLAGMGFLSFSSPKAEKAGRTESRRLPNILFAIADDQSYPHASAYGSKLFQTPSFDAVAARGVLFNNAFVAAPQCSPSRAAILTGRNIWQLEEAGTHSSYFPSKFPVFTDALEAAGYFPGYTGKAWDPGNWKDAGWKRNPVGGEYNQRKHSAVPASGISDIDYAANFRDFLAEKPSDRPFFFWYGSKEPHRVYEKGSGKKAGLRESDLVVPAFLPNDAVVREDMLDYALEVNWFDRQLGEMMKILAERGELDNTIIIVTADNGMAFPYAKANLTESGTHVPLAICGPGVSGSSRRVDDLVSLTDLAPTLLDMAGVAHFPGMTGRTMMPILQQRSSGRVDPSRRSIVTGRERHTHARPDNLGYPARALRDSQYLYVRNEKPERWPAGDPPPPGNAQLASTLKMKPIVSGYEDIDDSPTKSFMISNRSSFPGLFRLGFEKRGEEQLFDISTDPYCLNDLSGDVRKKNVLQQMRLALADRLRSEGDPRSSGDGDVFESYPRFGAMRPFSGFREQGKYNPAFASARPNFIFILTDDLGWSSFSMRMDDRVPASASDYHETPNIERFAGQSLRFTRGYSPDPICSPTRRSIQFGQTSIRQGEDSTFHRGYRAIPQVLKSIDPSYRAAHFGKWDLRAGVQPEGLGYDLSDGNTGNKQGNTSDTPQEKWDRHTSMDNPKQVDSLANRSVRFMQQQVRDGHPFFLQISHYATHANLETTPAGYKRFAAKHPGKKHSNPAYAGMLHDLDRSIGDVIKEVDRLGIAGNTYIVIMADNGGVEFIPPVSNRLDHPSNFSTPMRNHPLRGGKWTLYEGGIRVPFMVRGPGVKPGQTDIPVIGWDLLPTFARLAGGGIDGNGIDGGSFAGLLKGSATKKIDRPSELFYFHRFHKTYPHSAVIRGRYKLIRFWQTGKTELYDLESDPGEENDLSVSRPELAKELLAGLMGYMRSVNPELAKKYF